MNEILICGAAGFTNRGDDAILWGMLSQLRARVWARPMAVAGGPELPALVAPFSATSRSYEDRRELARAIEDAELVILGGGGMLYDIEYDANLSRMITDPPDRQWLYELAKLATAARVANRPVMGYALGVGPLVSTAARDTARYLAETVHVLTLRDQASADLLIECGVSPARLHVATDPAVMVEPSEGETVQQWFAAHGLVGLPHPWIGLNLRPWFRILGSDAGREEQMAGLIAAMTDVVQRLQSQLHATVILLPFQTLNDDDAAVLRQVVEGAVDRSRVILTATPTNPAEVAGVLSQLDVFMGMRMHSLLLSAAAGTPFVALPYSPKVIAAVKSLDMTEFMHPVDTLEPEAVVASCERVLHTRASLRANLLDARTRLRASSELSAELAWQLLHGQRLQPQAPASSMPVQTEAQPRVLMQIRPDFREKPGGDVVQLEELLPYLRDAGVTVELTGEMAPDLSSWDLLHTINLDRPEEPYQHCLHALECGKPIALSTVHIDLSEFYEWGNTDFWILPDPAEGLPQPQPAPPLNPLQRRERALAHLQRQAIIDWSTVYLPNSQGNLEYLQQTFHLDPVRAVVVPNGIRERFFQATPDLFIERYGLREFVLCVGRIEKKKNQLGLIAALRGQGLPLVIVGRANPPEYLELCRRYADENVHFIEHLSEDELVSACAAAKVHALTSWVELPGLTSLEAGAAGCNIVSTDRGSPPEYLQDMAWYCDPGDLLSIRDAVLTAYQAPRTERLRDHLRVHYTWKLAADKTLEGYRQALALNARQSAAEQRTTRQEALQQHAAWLERLAADRQYELAFRQQHFEQWRIGVEADREHWRVRAKGFEEHARNLERSLQQCREEIDRITSRRVYRYANALSRLFRRRK